MCLYPKLIYNPKYKANKKNGGVIPPITDERVLMVPVGCGKCMECMKKKAREWQIRMTEEIRTDKTGIFVTLTFTEKNLKELTKIARKEIAKWELKKSINSIEENEVARIAVRRFLERWRKKHKKSVKHWLVTELGHTGTERIHMHGIIFTDKKEDIEKIWGYGMVWLGTFVNEKTINYIIKYIHKVDEDHKGYTPKVLTSSGIGKGYTNRSDSKSNKYVPRETNEAYKYRDGRKSSLPIYYRNKIYTDEEKEKLWLEKLDKQERWVGGEKVDISKNENEYYKLLEYYRLKNEQYGYGNDKDKWSLKEYKESRKKLKNVK